MTRWKKMDHENIFQFVIDFPPIFRFLKVFTFQSHIYVYVWQQMTQKQNLQLKPILITTIK